jgi:hypothetical protein
LKLVRFTVIIAVLMVASMASPALAGGAGGSPCQEGYVVAGHNRWSVGIDFRTCHTDSHFEVEFTTQMDVDAPWQIVSSTSSTDDGDGEPQGSMARQLQVRRCSTCPVVTVGINVDISGRHVSSVGQITLGSGRQFYADAGGTQGRREASAIGRNVRLFVLIDEAPYLNEPPCPPDETCG